MDMSSLSSVSDVLLHHGYLFLFIAMCIEGPLLSIAAAFAAAMGHFTIPGIFFVSMAGDIVPDAIYYWIGRIGGTQIIDRWGKRLKLHPERVRHIRELLVEHSVKTVVAVKFMPMVGLMTVGAFRMPFRKYISICIAVTLVRSIVLITLGYQFGSAFNVIAKYFHTGELIIFGVFLLIAVFFAYRLFVQAVGRWMDIADGK